MTNQTRWCYSCNEVKPLTKEFFTYANKEHTRFRIKCRKCTNFDSMISHRIHRKVKDMNIDYMLNKSKPLYKQKREMSKSEYNKLVDRNTELIDILKEKEEEIERLNNIINELEKILDENVELTYVHNGKRQYNKTLTEGGLLFRDYIKSKLQELKGCE